MPIIFEALQISKSFGLVHALSDVSVTLHAGEVLGIIGENGTGKSTLMNIFSGKMLPSKGELLVDSQPVQFTSPIVAQRAGIAIAPQEINLVPHLSVAENILLGAHQTGAFGIDWRATKALATKHLHEVDDRIDPDAIVGDLSKAQQQLVQIARAAATSARILIFDEPTAALTHRETEKLFAYIRRLKTEGRAAFYISQRLDEVLALLDQITVLRDGKVAGELSPQTATREQMVSLMAGRPASSLTQPPRAVPDDAPEALRVEGLSRAGEFHGTVAMSWGVWKSPCFGQDYAASQANCWKAVMSEALNWPLRIM